MFKRILDNTDPGSKANKFRLQRFKYFEEHIKDLPRPVKILDVGGTENFWVQMGKAGNKEYIITLLNHDITKNYIKDNFIFIHGDAVDLSQFSDKKFDVVFSNSVIEHIPQDKNRQKMADEIIRTCKNYFVQTPNYYFPFEPHFLFPFFQFLPKFLNFFLLKNFNMGWYKKCSTKSEAEEILSLNKLLTENELRGYFRNCRIIKEKYMGMTKSLIAVNN